MLGLVDSSHEILFLHRHSSALEMLQSWMILLSQKKNRFQRQFSDNSQLFSSELVPCLQKPSCCGQTVTLSFRQKHEDVAIENDKPLLSHKWGRKSFWPDLGPPHKMAERKRAARILSGDEGSAVSCEELTPCRAEPLTS